MTAQISEILIYNGQRQSMIRAAPLEDFFTHTGKRPPFLVNATLCHRGYKGTWSLIDGKLWLDRLDGYIAKGKLVATAKRAYHHVVDYKDQTLCSEITLADIFPGAVSPVFADWFSGEISASLDDEVMRNDEGDEVSVERTLKLCFQNGVLTSEDVELEFPLTLKTIEAGLTNPDATTRLEFVKLGKYHLTPAQIERGLLDEDSSVRQEIMCQRLMSLTPGQLERAMTDECPMVRWFAFLFEQYAPTPIQLERALTDPSPDIRGHVSKWCDLLTPEQIDRGLTDEVDEVRETFASRYHNPTPAQIERGLTDKYWVMRFLFIINENVVLTPEQIQRGLKDEIEPIKREVASRYNCNIEKRKR